MKKMTIGKAARKAGVGVETIRFYERKGIIEQPLKPIDSSFRIYPRQTVDRILFIRQAQELGFTLAEIDELLSLQTNPHSDCADVRKRAQTKLDEVMRKQRQLENIQASLEKLINACPGKGAIKKCSIMDAIEGNFHKEKKS